MRSKKFILGLAVAGLVISSCGGSDKTSDTGAPADTSSADSGDRDRNVGASAGWGDNGSGVSRTVIGELADLTSQTAIFVRSEKTSSGGSLNATFATAVVSTTVKDVETSTFSVFAYQKNKATSEFEALAGFGTNGAVSIALPAADDSVAATPRSWTIISRKYAALLFEMTASEGMPDGLIRFYDLSTGRLATELGKSGEIRLIGAEVGLPWVSEIGLRGVDAGGNVHLVALGGSWGEEFGPWLYGFTADGKPDAQVGGANGSIDLASFIRSDMRDAVGQARLADPGVAPESSGAIGVAVPIAIPYPFEGSDAEQMSMRGIAALVFQPSADGAPLGSNPSTVSAARIDVSAEQLTIDSAVIAGPGLRVISRVSWSNEDEKSFEILVDPAKDYPTEMVPQPTFVADDDEIHQDQWHQASTTSNQGDWIGIDVVDDGNLASQTLQICFVRDDCTTEANKFTRALVPFPANYAAYYYSTSAFVDAIGLHVVTRKSKYLGRSAEFLQVSLDAAGLSPATRRLDSSFGTVGFDSSKNLVTQVGRPQTLGGQTVFALEQTQDTKSPMQLRLQSNASTAKSIPLIRSEQIVDFQRDFEQLVVIDGSHVGVPAYVPNKNVYEVVLVSIDTRTGRVDPAFGNRGFLTIPQATSDFDSRTTCSERKLSWSSAGLTIIDMRWAGTDDGGCTSDIAKLSWRTVSPAGVVNPATEISPQFAEEEFGIDVATDGFGNLYLSTSGTRYEAATYSDIDDAGQPIEVPYRRRIDFAEVRRYNSSGALDPTFGKSGSVQIDERSVPEIDSLDNPRVAVDAAGHVYVVGMDARREHALVSVRLTSAGTLDHKIEATPAPTTTAPAPPVPSVDDLAGAPRPQTTQSASSQAGSLLAGRISQVVSGMTGSIVATGVTPSFNSLGVTWKSAPGIAVTATALPGGQSCTSEDGTCVIAGLDPSQSYSIVLAKKGDPTPPISAALTAPIKPVFELKIGKSANTKSVVKPASKGKATWKVTGGCVLNAAKSKVTAPKTPTTCQLSVTTAKDGKTPKTTKSVTIAVTK